MTRKRPGLSAGTFLFTATKKTGKTSRRVCPYTKKQKARRLNGPPGSIFWAHEYHFQSMALLFQKLYLPLWCREVQTRSPEDKKMRPSPGDIRVIKPLRRPSNLCEVASLLLNSSKFGPSQSFLFSNKDHATTTRFPDIPANGIVYPATTIPCSSAARAAMRPASTISRAR